MYIFVIQTNMNHVSMSRKVVKFERLKIVSLEVRRFESGLMHFNKMNKIVYSFYFGSFF